MKSGVVRDFMQEGRLAQRPAVGQGLGALGGVEDDLDLAVLDGVHDVRAALEDLVDLGGLDAVLRQIPLRAGRGDDAEAERAEQPGGIQDARLVGVLDRYEYGAFARQARAAADLALGEGDRKRAVEADDLAGGP